MFRIRMCVPGVWLLVLIVIDQDEREEEGGGGREGGEGEGEGVKEVKGEWYVPGTQYL